MRISRRATRNKTASNCLIKYARRTATISATACAAATARLATCECATYKRAGNRNRRCTGSGGPSRASNREANY